MVSCTVTTSWKHKRTKMITDQFIFAGLGQFTFSSKSKQISTCQYKQSILIAFTKIISEYLMKLLFFLSIYVFTYLWSVTSPLWSIAVPAIRSKCWVRFMQRHRVVTGHLATKTDTVLYCQLFWLTWSSL